jgi:hypothetical protein
MQLTIFGKRKRRISYYSHQAFEQTSTMNITKSNDHRPALEQTSAVNITEINDHRPMCAFEVNAIPFESISEQDCEDCQLTSSMGSIYPSSIPFPWRLHEILDDAEKSEGFQSIISWLPGHENAFRVHNSAAFVDMIMPKYFHQTKYKSFQRQLNIWDFCRIPSGRDKGGYVHPCFIRGKHSLCRQMVRRKIKGDFSNSKMTASVATHAISSRSQQSRRNSLKQWMDIHDDDEQALLQVFPSNFDLESIFS